MLLRFLSLSLSLCVFIHINGLYVSLEIFVHVTHVYCSLYILSIISFGFDYPLNNNNNNEEIRKKLHQTITIWTCLMRKVSGWLTVFFLSIFLSFVSNLNAIYKEWSYVYCVALRCIALYYIILHCNSVPLEFVENFPFYAFFIHATINRCLTCSSS